MQGKLQEDKSGVVDMGDGDGGDKGVQNGKRYDRNKAETLRNATFSSIT